jgi:predicted nucleic acid-binding protein
MEILIYPDTNFYLDYFEDRRDNMRPLGEFAFSVLKRAIGCEFKIALSDWVVEELERHVAKERIVDFINRLRDLNKVVLIEKECEDTEKARRLSNNYDDALHVILAVKAGAKFLVTRNIQHFLDMRHLIKPILPENL